MNNKRIYLAAPYSHELKAVREGRARIVSQVAAELMLQGFLVFSPISHGFMIEAEGIGGDAKTWEDFNNSILEDWAHELYVLKLEGWEKSKGVKVEVECAIKNNLPITFIDWRLENAK